MSPDKMKALLTEYGAKDERPSMISWIFMSGLKGLIHSRLELPFRKFDHVQRVPIVPFIIEDDFKLFYYGD